VSQRRRPEYEIALKVRKSRDGSVELDRSVMAPLCAGSLLEGGGGGVGLIHERLKGANVPAERVFSLSKNVNFCSSSVHRFQARYQNFKKLLLALSCPSVRPSVRPYGKTRLQLDGF
jgi:hypothetical protein